MISRSLLSRSLRVIGQRYLAEDLSKKRDRFQGTDEEILLERRRTFTRGEAATMGTDDPQYYHTTTDDNYQKTTVTIINRDVENNYTAVKSLLQHGFRMHDGTLLLGPVALFPKVTLSWMVPNVESITEDSLKLFVMLEPQLDVLIVGVGDKKNVESVSKRLTPFLRKHRLHAEILSTMDACATFNYLNDERRCVAAALFPPDEVHMTRMDRLKAAVHYDEAGNEPASIVGVPTDILGLPKFKNAPGAFGNIKQWIDDRQVRSDAEKAEEEKLPKK